MNKLKSREGPDLMIRIKEALPFRDAKAMISHRGMARKPRDESEGSYLYINMYRPPSSRIHCAEPILLPLMAANRLSCHGVTRNPRDHPILTFLDGTFRMPRDGTLRLARDGTGRMPRDATISRPRDGTHRSPRDGIGSMPRDWIPRSPRDEILKFPRDWITRMPRDIPILAMDRSYISYCRLIFYRPGVEIKRGKTRFRWRKTMWENRSAGPVMGEVHPARKEKYAN